MTELARGRLQLIVFLIIWPGINLLLVSTILHDFGFLRLETLGTAALRLWLVSVPSLVAIRLMERRFPSVLHQDNFLRYGLLHIVVIVAVGALTAGLVELPPEIPRPTNLIVPRVVVTLEIVLYLSVLRILRLQERSYEAAARAREAELNVLRSQSNPHFLFNTLNLITAEIASDPQNAREIVFDLSDLLRSNIKMAQQSLTTLAEEMNLVSLYLKLQQQRFKNRLTFDIALAPETSRVRVPSLLLQPVVENTIKWAVTPYASEAHIHIETKLEAQRLSIVFRDTGPPFDETQITEGNGLRILRKTLELHYPQDFEMCLRSTPEGGLFSLCLPVKS